MKFNSFAQWWFSPEFPRAHVKRVLAYTPVGFGKKLRNFYRTWIVHPLKRRIVRFYVKLLQRFFGLKVIGITGSAGKTTTKDMIVSILRLRGETVYSLANIDPVYNIPTTILRCSPKTKYLVLEMGVEYPGEIDFYLWLVRPNVGVIMNIYPTHTKFFGDAGGVFREKSKLVKGLRESSVAVLPRQDKFLLRLAGKIKPKIVWFGDGSGVMASLEKITGDFETEFMLIFDQDPKQRVKVRLPIPGDQFVTNALAASAVAKSLGFTQTEIKRGLERVKLPEHRMRVIKHQSGALIFDDSYNNNPEAAKAAALSFGLASPGKSHVIVFGDMLELGHWESKYHMELGKFLGKIQPFKLICVGKASQVTAQVAGKLMGESRVSFVETWEEAYQAVKPYLRRNTSILIKGSRSLGLDNLVSRLL